MQKRTLDYEILPFYSTEGATDLFISSTISCGIVLSGFVYRIVPYHFALLILYAITFGILNTVL